jgi:hypothetical protein
MNRFLKWLFQPAGESFAEGAVRHIRHQHVALTLIADGMAVPHEGRLYRLPLCHDGEDY